MVRRKKIAAVMGLLLALAGPAAGQDFELKDPLPVEVRAEIMINFECLEGFRITQERQYSYARCHGALPATCTETRYELLECRDGRFETIAEWSGGTECSYDYDGTWCEDVVELRERDFVPLGPGPYHGDPGAIPGALR